MTTTLAKRDERKMDDQIYPQFAEWMNHRVRETKNLTQFFTGRGIFQCIPGQDAEDRELSMSYQDHVHLAHFLQM